MLTKGRLVAYISANVILKEEKEIWKMRACFGGLCFFQSLTWRELKLTDQKS